MYFNGITTAGHLIKRLEEMIGELSAMDEDDVISGRIDLADTKTCMNDVIYDRDDCSDGEEGIRTWIHSVPPKYIHEYTYSAFEDARDNDYFWEGVNENKEWYWKQILEFKPGKEDEEE